MAKKHSRAKSKVNKPENICNSFDKELVNYKPVRKMGRNISRHRHSRKEKIYLLNI